MSKPVSNSEKLLGVKITTKKLKQLSSHINMQKLCTTRQCCAAKQLGSNKLLDRPNYMTWQEKEKF